MQEEAVDGMPWLVMDEIRVGDLFAAFILAGVVFVSMGK